MKTRAAGGLELQEQTNDGRNIDERLGALDGEAAQQQVGPSLPSRHAPPQPEARETPSDRAERSYYGLPVLKEPVWIASVPTYFFVGGLTGAVNVLAAVADVGGRGQLPRFVRRAHRVGAIGDAVSAALLIADLGRPSRFLNMLRVFRITSPMSVGSWVLAVGGALSGGALLLEYFPRPLRDLSRIAGIGAGVLGMPLAAYTGVLLANTAVPVWASGARTLPLLFAASAVASAGAFFELFGTATPRADKVVRRYAVAGKALTIAASELYAREVSRPERVARPLKQGVAAALWSATRALTAASLAASIIGGRRATRIAGALGTLGGLALRYAVFHAGKVSSRDPHATFDMQRGAGKVRGALEEYRVREIGGAMHAPGEPVHAG